VFQQVQRIRDFVICYAFAVIRKTGAHVLYISFEMVPGPVGALFSLVRAVSFVFCSMHLYLRW
jgi:hypothetical protein